VNQRGEENYLSAREAAEVLGVKLPTLYAYVSRGYLRSLPGEAATGAKRYSRQDVEALRQRQDLKRNPREAAEGALNWGVPILPSALTAIDDGRLYYRGRDAVGLSRRMTLEAVAELLWSGEGVGLAFKPLSFDASTGIDPLPAFSAALPLLAERDPSAYDPRPEVMVRTAARIVASFAKVAVEEGEEGDFAERLARKWRGDVSVAAGIRAALVLCADHELNASSFTARCVASAGGTLYGAVSAGLAALAGTRHGGSTARVAAFLDEAGRLGDGAAAVAARRRRGESTPGFGHPLYPAGDPRGEELLRYANREVADLVRAMASAVGDPPNVDCGLAALGRSYWFPSHAPLTLFAIGRTVGLAAHAIEQCATGSLIRPRARYVGVRPIPEAEGTP
jgi:citrate synthase